MAKKNKPWQARLSDGLSSFLTKYLTKALLKKLVISGGIKGWLISFVVEELVEEADEHLIEPAIRKVGYVKDVIKGHYTYKGVQDAQSDDDWIDSSSSV